MHAVLCRGAPDAFIGRAHVFGELVEQRCKDNLKTMLGKDAKTQKLSLLLCKLCRLWSVPRADCRVLRSATAGRRFGVTDPGWLTRLAAKQKHLSSGLNTLQLKVVFERKYGIEHVFP